ncbi:MAG: FmdB family zinc ribbon protein [Planctomycetota bacterium]
MPTYDYRCTACKHTFEEFQTMSAKHLKKCPKCGKPALERLIGTGAAIVFKGSGFYQTDYRSEGYKQSAAADKPASDTATKTETKAETKTDVKSEGKADAKAEAKPAEKTVAKPESKPDARKPEPKGDSRPKSKTKKD